MVRYGVDEWEIGILVDFVGNFKVRFLSVCRDESAIWIPEKTSYRSGFCYPLPNTCSIKHTIIVQY